MRCLRQGVYTSTDNSIYPYNNDLPCKPLQISGALILNSVAQNTPESDAHTCVLIRPITRFTMDTPSLRSSSEPWGTNSGQLKLFHYNMSDFSHNTPGQFVLLTSFPTQRIQPHTRDYSLMDLIHAKSIAKGSPLFYSAKTLLKQRRQLGSNNILCTK